MADIPQIYIDIGAAKQQKAIALFSSLMSQYAGENIIRQITAAGKTELIGNAVRDVLFWGQTGSLYEVYRALEKMIITPDMGPFLTEEKRQLFKNKIVEMISSL